MSSTRKKNRAKARTKYDLHIVSVLSNVKFSVHAMLYVFEDNEAVIKMIIKGRSMRHVSRTHRVSLIDNLTEWTWTPRFRYGTLTPNTRRQTHWQKDASHVKSGIVSFVCSTSAISALFAAPRISACLAASPKGWRKRCKNNHKRTGLWPNPGLWWWTWPVLLPQDLHRWAVRLRREARGYSKLQSDKLDYQGGLTQAQIKIPVPTQRRVLKVGKEMLNCSSAQRKIVAWSKMSEVSESARRIWSLSQS